MFTVAYMGGGGCQKWPKTCLRNLRTAPFLKRFQQNRASEILFQIPHLPVHPSVHDSIIPSVCVFKKLLDVICLKEKFSLSTTSLQCLQLLF